MMDINTNNNDTMDKQCVDFFKTGYIIAKTEDLVGCYCDSEDVVNTYLDVKARDIDIEDIRNAFAKVEADIDESCDDTDEDCDDCDCCSSGDCDCDSEDDCEDTKDLDDIEKVIFSGNATIVFWSNGEKSVVKCQKGDTYSREEGLAMAICKMMYGNDNTFNDVINAAMKKAIVVKDEPKKKKTATAKITSGKLERKN